MELQFKRMASGNEHDKQFNKRHTWSWLLLLSSPSVNKILILVYIIQAALKPLTTKHTMNSSSWPLHEYCFSFGVKRRIRLPVFWLSFTDVLKISCAFSPARLIGFQDSSLRDIIDFSLRLRTGVVTAAQWVLVTHYKSYWVGWYESQFFNICWEK